MIQLKRKHYLIRLLRRLGLLHCLSFEYQTSFASQTFTLPLIEGLNEALLYKEPSFKTDILQQVNKLGYLSQFVDIGASFGQTLLEVISFSRKIDYFGFEPNPISFGLLKRLVEVNNIQATLFPCACSNSNTIKPIYKNNTCNNHPVDTGATLVPEIRPGMYSETSCSYINCVKFNSIFEKLSKEVLENSRNHKSKIKYFLEKNHYEIYLCDINSYPPHRLKQLKKINDLPIDLYRNSPNSCDFLFVPKEIQL